MARLEHQSLVWPSISRRQLLAAALGAPLWPQGAAAQTSRTSATAQLKQRPLVFPRDLGSHPDSSIEWWYITGELHAGARSFGFQITFFCAHVDGTQTLHSNFAAKQIYFAHAAVSDVAKQRLRHDQRSARSSGSTTLDLAQASSTDTNLVLRDWSLKRQNQRYLTQAKGADFAFDLTLNQTQPLLLQGDQGWSRKGPDPSQASFYYSLPQLQVSGQLQLDGQSHTVTGRAWLDHEWSQKIMAAPAVGWDWVGINLNDGSALTAFRLRDQNGGQVWAGGSQRAANSAQAQIFQPEQVQFEAHRLWTSPNSTATYPVQWLLSVPSSTASAAPRSYTVRALIDNQELDSRQTSGAIYWEGLSELLDEQGQAIGRGYLEMTGYAQPLRL